MRRGERQRAPGADPASAEPGGASRASRDVWRRVRRTRSRVRRTLPTASGVFRDPRARAFDRGEGEAFRKRGRSRNARPVRRRSSRRNLRAFFLRRRTRRTRGVPGRGPPRAACARVAPRIRRRRRADARRGRAGGRVPGGVRAGGPARRQETRGRGGRRDGRTRASRRRRDKHTKKSPSAPRALRRGRGDDARGGDDAAVRAGGGPAVPAGRRARLRAGARGRRRRVPRGRLARRSAPGARRDSPAATGRDSRAAPDAAHRRRRRTRRGVRARLRRRRRRRRPRRSLREFERTRPLDFRGARRRAPHPERARRGGGRVESGRGGRVGESGPTRPGRENTRRRGGRRRGGGDGADDAALRGAARRASSRRRRSEKHENVLLPARRATGASRARRPEPQRAGRRGGRPGTVFRDGCARGRGDGRGGRLRRARLGARRASLRGRERRADARAARYRRDVRHARRRTRRKRRGRARDALGVAYRRRALHGPSRRRFARRVAARRRRRARADDFVRRVSQDVVFDVVPGPGVADRARALRGGRGRDARRRRGVEHVAPASPAGLRLARGRGGRRRRGRAPLGADDGDSGLPRVHGGADFLRTRFFRDG